MTPAIIEQTNDRVRQAIASVRIDRNPATMNALYSALHLRRNARSMRTRPTSAHWIKLGL